MYVVTGMHRSGTSMISHLLGAAGVPFGSESGFYSTDEWNAKGYFERVDVMDLNSELITGWRRNAGAIERAMCSVRYTTFPDPMKRREAMNPYAGRVSAMAEELGSIAIKDPRFCLTLDFWREHASVEGVVVCLRHPHSVAQSLSRRQRYPRWLGLRFWNYHLRNLLAQLPDANVLYLDFDVLGTPDHAGELEAIRRHFKSDVSLEDLESRYAEIFSSRLRHFEPDAELSLPGETRELWAELKRRHAEQ